MKPWNIIKPDDIDVVAPDGQVRSHVKGYYNGELFIIDDMTVDVRPGDEIRRLLPNGREETFVVGDPKFYNDGPFVSHYQVSITPRGVFDRHTGGNYTINLSGSNARVNIGSTDNSVNDVYITNENFSALSCELQRLRQALAPKAQEPEHCVAIGALASAELAAKEGNASNVRKALSGIGSAGRWVLDGAKEIGVQIAAEVVKRHLGLPPG